MTLTKNIFTGEYSYSIDSKNRVNIPSNFRNCLSSDNKKTFVITKGLDSCIWVYPLIFWKKIEDYFYQKFKFKINYIIVTISIIALSILGLLLYD